MLEFLIPDYDPVRHTNVAELNYLHAYEIMKARYEREAAQKAQRKTAAAPARAPRRRTLGS